MTCRRLGPASTSLIDAEDVGLVERVKRCSSGSSPWTGGSVAGKVVILSIILGHTQAYAGCPAAPGTGGAVPGRFCRSTAAPSATACHTACDSALRLAKRAGSR